MKREYVHVYRRSIFYVIWLLILGVGFLVAGIYSFSDTNVAGIIMVTMGGLILVFIIKEIQQGPVVKLSRQGIWTNSLGFKTWSEVIKVKIENKSFYKYISRSGSEKMFIYLIGDERTKPSDITDILGLANKKHLEATIHDFLVNYQPEATTAKTDRIDSSPLVRESHRG
jgi:hypothetical protein